MFMPQTQNSGQARWWPLVTWLGALFAGAAGCARAWAALSQYLQRRQAIRAAQAQDQDLRLHWFREHDFVTAARDYLVPFCSNVDPSDREDLRNTVAVREKVLDALDRELDSEDRRHI